MDPKMNHLAFAQIVSWVSAFGSRAMDADDIRSLEEMAKRLGSGMSSDAARDLLKAMQDGKKIEAIKAFRTLTNATLIDSKCAVETYWTAPASQQAVGA